MKCKDCIYLSPNTPLFGNRKIIGYCTYAHHFGQYRYEKDECPNDAGVRKTSIKSNIQTK